MADLIKKDNFDRHQYAVYRGLGNDTVPILFDNGRGFADPTRDDLFNQFEQERGCCPIKKSTFLKYLKLALGPDSFSELMRRSLIRDPVAPVLLEEDLRALDRRVIKILLYFNGCLEQYSLGDVISDDMK